MNIINTYPPNIDAIRVVLNPHADTTFAYGDTIYNPAHLDLAPDLIHHEEVHQKQQGNDPAGWWLRYLSDTAFRLSQELEAYGEQYAFAKKHIENMANDAESKGKRLAAGKNNLLRYALESMARALSGEDYGRLLSYGEAESKIKHYARQVNK